jgi:putative ABC transport system permease protein
MLEATPGVRAASVASQFPPQGPFSTPFRFEGRDSSGATLPMALITAVSDTHFTTLGVQVVSGRPFGTADRDDAPDVVAVNQAFVSRYLPGVPPLGQRIRTGPADRLSPPKEIVAVVSNTQNRGLQDPSSPEIFVPLHQQVNNQLFVLVRTKGDAASILPAVRQQIASIDPDQPIYQVRTLEETLAASTFGPRFSVVLFGVFAVVALTLAAIGIFGVMSYAVTARTQEIGVRLAVGANRRDVVWLVLGQVVRMTSIGLALGIAGVLAMGRMIRQALFEVQPGDPLTMTGVIVVLGAVALVAGWLPAWRASRVDPVNALRYE